MLFLFLLVASVLSINLEDINIEDIDETQLFNDLQNLLDSNNVDSNTLLEGFDLEALEDMDLSELLPSLQHHNTDPDSTSNLQDMIASALSSFTSKKKTNDVKKKKKKPIVTPDSITPMKSYEHLLWPTFRSYPQVSIWKH